MTLAINFNFNFLYIVPYNTTRDSKYIKQYDDTKLVHKTNEDNPINSSVYFVNSLCVDFIFVLSDLFIFVRIIL